METVCTGPPDVLVIMLDQIHHRCLGYAGHPVVRTPNLDRLRADSVNFSHCYVQNGYCLPSRTSYLSGQYLYTHRQYGFTGLVSEHTPSMGMYFTERGYHTAIVGKAHVNTLGERLGFSEFIPTLPEDIYQSTDQDRNYLAYCKQHGLSYPNDQVHGDATMPIGEVRVSAVPADLSIERYTANESIRVLRDRKSPDRPLFLIASFDRPHPPITPSQEYLELYHPDEIPLETPLGEEQLTRKPRYIKDFAASKDALTVMGDEAFRIKLSCYYALITHIDEEIGRILDALRETDRYDDTIIAFCADHGDLAGYLGLSNKFSNRCYYDHIVRTPMLLKYPTQLHAGKTVDAPVEAIDLFPTLRFLSGDMAPMPELDGKNLDEYVCDERGAIARFGDIAFSESWSIKMIRKGRYKLIYTIPTGERELYDLEADPDERENLITPQQTDRNTGKASGHTMSESDYMPVILDLKQELIRRRTPIPSAAREKYINRLFDCDPSDITGAMAPLAKWKHGIEDGGGFWRVNDKDHVLTVFPWRNEIYLEREKMEKRENADRRFFMRVTDDEMTSRLLDKLIDHIYQSSLPVSLMMEVSPLVL